MGGGVLPELRQRRGGLCNGANLKRKLGIILKLKR